MLRAAAQGGLLSEPQLHLRSAAEASQWLRAQRELSFYGDVEWIPTERYGPADGERALQAAQVALELAGRLIDPG